MVTKIGNNAANIIKGTKFSDKLFGKGGNDKIYGSGRKDNIDGGSGRDVIDGSSGNDWIHGGTGNDKLTGGGGSDVFTFKANSGVDRITDFNVAADKLAIKQGINGIQTAADVLTHATESVNAAGKPVVTIDLGGGSKIVLTNVSLDDLTADPAAHFAIV